MTITFDGSFDGFLSVVHACYYKKLSPTSILPESEAQLSLGGEPVFIETDPAHAAKVFSAVREKISLEAAEFVYHAFLHADFDRFMAMLSYIKLGFKEGHMVNSHLQQECVRRVHKLAGHVRRESHLLCGFCRFEETKQGVFYCKITPKNDVLPMLAVHFIQRFSGMAWVLHDKVRGQAAISDGEKYIITSTPKDAVVEYAENEEATQELWVAFFKAHTIEARKNLKLQRQMMPIYFRRNMTEFIKN